MIKDADFLKQFEDEFIAGKGKLTYEASMQLFTNMWNQAVKFGVFPPKDPLEDIDVDIRIAKALNACLKKSSLE